MSSNIHADGGRDHRILLAQGLQSRGELKKAAPTLITDRDLNQYEEVMGEGGVYVKRKIGNKKTDGNMTAAETAYFIDSKPCKVIDGLYIGSLDAAKSLESMKSNAITHIVCVASKADEQKHFPREFDYMTHEVADLPDAPLLDMLPELVSYIDQVRDMGGVVFVHCNQGISRSATIVIAYLIFKLRIPYAQAFQMVSTARPSIRPNYGFEQQLALYQRRVLDLHTITETETESASASK